MTQKYLYLVNYFAPSSHSDGGLINVIAKDEDECFDLIAEWDNDTWTSHYGKLRENVIKSQRFALLEEEESGIVEFFVV